MAPRARHFARILGAALLSAMLLLCGARAKGVDAMPTVVELEIDANGAGHLAPGTRLGAGAEG